MNRNYRTKLVVELMMFATCFFMICFLGNLPIAANPNAAADDGLMLSLAKSIVKGEWLGEYSYLTMVKGPVFSILLAVFNKLGISFVTMEVFLYVFGVFVFSIAMNKAFNNCFFMVILFCALLFNPIAYCKETLQETYRCGIGLGFSLIILGYYIYFYFQSNMFSILSIGFAIITSIAYSLLIYIRDDSIWIKPFMVVAIIIIMIRKMLVNKVNNKILLLSVILLVLPFFMAHILGAGISKQNESHYGVYCVTDSKNTNFARCYNLLISIEDNTDIQRVYMSKSKRDAIYEYSPTLRGITLLENQIAAWSSYARNNAYGDYGEIEGTYFYWALRDAVSRDGYYDSGERSEQFYGKVYDELSEAVEDGKLKTIRTMPSIFMMPWRDGYFSLLVNEMINSVNFIYSFEELNVFGSDMPNANASDQEMIEVAQFCHGYTINSVTLSDKKYISEIDKKVAVIRFVIKIYQVFNPLLFWASIILGVVWCVSLILEIGRKRYSELDIFVVVVGIIFSFLLIVGGVSYIEISDYQAIFYTYLAPAYLLLIIAEVVLMFKGMNAVVKLMHGRK